MNRECLPFFRIFTEPVGYYSENTALGIDRKTRFRSRKRGPAALQYKVEKLQSWKSDQEQDGLRDQRH